MIDRVPLIPTQTESGLRRGHVKVIDHTGHEDTREVSFGEGPDAWAFWARETRFALDNTAFITIGDAVYRSATVDRIEPVESAQSGEGEALQACMGILAVIRDAQVAGEQHVRYLCAQMLQTLEQRGYSLLSE